MSSTWGGRRSTTARALFAGRLPLPCSRCGRMVMPTQRWDVDHLLPRWAGGTDEPSNLWPAHARCNQADGGRRGAQVTNARKAHPQLASNRERGIRGL